MDFDEDLRNNPWAQYVGINSENLGDLECIPEEIHPKDQTDTKLLPVDIELYGSCPVYDEMHLISCKRCRRVLLPRSLMNHMDKRHGTKEERITTSTPATSASSSCSSASSSRSCSSTTPSWDKETSWTLNKDTSHGAVLPSSVNVNTSANIVRVKPENSSLKVDTTPYHKHSKSSYLMLKKNMQSKKELSQPPKSVVMLPELCSNIPSTSTDILPCTSSSSQLNEASPSVDNKFGKDSVHDSVQSPQPTSTSSEKPMDCSEASSNEKKTPTLEKLVLRRVLQTGEKTPAVRRQSVEGMKGVARNKKDSSKEPYFMVVKDKDRQQNLLATRQQIRKQSNVVHQEKDKVEQKMKHLESIRDKLITQLFQELQSVKQKLNECIASKTDLQKEILAYKEQIEESKLTAEQNKMLIQKLEESKLIAEKNKALSKQNHEHIEEKRNLEKKVEILTSSLLEQAQMYSNYANQGFNYSSERLAQQLQAAEEQKLQLQRRLEELEKELRELKKTAQFEKGTLENKIQKYALLLGEMQKKLSLAEAEKEDLRMHKEMLEKHVPQETLYRVKSQYAAFTRQSEIYEIYPGMIPNATSIAAPSVPFTEKLITDIKNNYLTFQHQVTNDRSEMFQQTMNEEVS
ncbi:unnamed protein product [Larinioides sclopetarius]|uniref:C2H2-type domain-containing protein n=1 Tax=Larinioides sclopetarius TaxID=280406 RepID=A0AAV2B0A6_9ARAC